MSFYLVIIEITKKAAYEKITKSEVFITHTIEDEAKETSIKLFNSDFKSFKYVSSKNSNSSQRLINMYSNEIINSNLSLKHYQKLKLVILFLSIINKVP